MVLRVVIDRPDPGRVETPEESVGIAECQRVSQDLSALLDVEDEFGEDDLGETYTLEVSSPGLDRAAAARSGLPALRGTAGEDRDDGADRAPERVRRTDHGHRGRRRDPRRRTQDAPGAARSDQAREPGRGILAAGSVSVNRDDGSWELVTDICRIRCCSRSTPSPRKRASSRKSSSAPCRTPSRRPRGSDTRTRRCGRSSTPETGADRALRRQAHRRRSHRSAEPDLAGRSAAALRRRSGSRHGDRVPAPDRETSGRIAAQTAKQVIFQKVREAERENVYAEYSNRVGEVVSGVVKRFENGDIIMELGRIEAQLPRKEQSRAENYAVGDRVRAVIRGVNRSAKGPQIVLSRTDPALLIKLFEQEVPEIYDGTVDDPRRRPRGRRPRQGGGLLARARRRPGRRLRRHEGHARAVDHPRAPRREDRHRRMVGGLGALRRPTRSARPRSSASRSWTTPRR